MTDIGYKRIIELIENYQLYAPEGPMTLHGGLTAIEHVRRTL